MPPTWNDGMLKYWNNGQQIDIVPMLMFSRSRFVYPTELTSKAGTERVEGSPSAVSSGPNGSSKSAPTYSSSHCGIPIWQEKNRLCRVAIISPCRYTRGPWDPCETYRIFYRPDNIRHTIVPARRFLRRLPAL